MIEFGKNELKSNGFYPNVDTYYGYPWPESPIFQTPVTPKENLRLFLNRKEFYWIPDLINDVNIIYPDIIPDCFAGKFEGGFDSFGVKWIPVTSNEYLPSFVEPGNPKLKDISAWRNLKFPDVDSWDWEASGKKFKKSLNQNRYNMGIHLSGFFERLISLLDFENAAVALLEDPEEVKAFFEKLVEYNIQILEHYKTYHDIDIALIHDDWGAQRAPFFSHDTVKTLIVPYLKRFVKTAHELDVKVVLHSCGNSEGFVQEMIDAAVDIWQMQLNANPNALKTIEDYKGQILFDIYDGIPFELDTENAKRFVENFYAQYGRSGVTSLSLMETNFDRGIDWAYICYEYARKNAMK